MEELKEVNFDIVAKQPTAEEAKDLLKVTFSEEKLKSNYKRQLKENSKALKLTNLFTN